MTDLPNSVHYRRYANVAGSWPNYRRAQMAFMWGQLAVLWNQVADRKAAKEALLPPQDQTHNSPPVDESGAHRQLAGRVVRGHLSPK